MPDGLVSRLVKAVVGPDAEAPSPFAEVGTSGLKRSGGFVHEEWHPKLGGIRGVRIFREMADNDAVIGATLFAIESFMRGAAWRVDPAGEDQKSLEAAKFLEECIDDMSHTFDDFIAEVLTMLPFGWSYFEEVFKRRLGLDQKDGSRRSKFTDGRIGWRKFSIRGQETLWRWEIDPDGGIRGMWQNDSYAGRGTVFIPIEKALLFRTRSNKNNPEGRSILRNAWRSWTFCKRIQEIEGIGIERDLAGYPIFEVPPEIMNPKASPENKQIRANVERAVQLVRRDENEGLVIPAEIDHTGKPTGYKFRLASTGGRRQIDVSATITRYEVRIAATMLHDWILLGSGKVGTQALAREKTEASALAIESILDSVAAVLNRLAVPRLFKLNPEFPQESWPTFQHGKIQKVDLEALAKFILDGVNSGAITPDRSIERHYRQAGKLPELEEEEVRDLTPTPSVPPPTDDGAPTPPPSPEGGQIAPEAEAVIDPKVALNGAQVTALKDMVTSFITGELPRETAIELMITAFPITRERAIRILGPDRPPQPPPQGDQE